MNSGNVTTWDYFLDAFIRCLKALPVTLELTLASVLIGFAIAVPLAIVHAKDRGIIARLVRAYVFVFTGTPLLVQMYTFYFGFSEFKWVQHLWNLPYLTFLKEGFFWVCLALICNTVAYSTVIFSGSIRNTDNGEVEAARAYGFSKMQTMWRIIIPSSLRRALPAYSNEVVLMLQATALASTCTVFEIMGEAFRYYGDIPRPFEAFGAAGLIYLGLTFILVQGFKWLERKYLAHLQPRAH